MGAFCPLQWVWLTWGYERFRNQFEREMDHLRLIADACFEQMHVDPPPRNELINGLYLRRRVEQAVRDIFIGMMSSLLNIQQEGSALAIPALKLVDLSDAAGHVRVRPEDFNRGDLVEASVQIDIEIAIDPRTGVPCMSVFFSFSKLTLLCRRNQLSEVSSIDVFYSHWW